VGRDANSPGLALDAAPAPTPAALDRLLPQWPAHMLGR
jgi:hypothetical protein